MTRFIVGRAVRGLVTLWIVVSAVFVVLRLSGDPARAMLGPEATPEAIEAFRTRHGLDEPIPVQYVEYLGNIARGDFGDSLKGGRPALELFLARVGATLELGAAAVLIALAIGIPAGVLAAVKRGSLWDRLAMGGAFIGQSAPNFFVGIMLILIFSLQVNLLPSSGRGEPSQLVMPAFTLATGLLATLARMSRSALLEVISNDYVRTARAKGLSDRDVIVTHTLRNAAIPVVTLLGLWASALIGGAAITETVFAWPGVGRLAVAAVADRDYPVIQLIVIVVAASVVAVNLLVDIAYGLLDPRISTASSGEHHQ
ncbi:MAG TPA: ABC transporter permease [Thermomicrobiales bacterium]|nr:ABC transporter permease [Thermomicrobiales bacterium]